MGSERYLGSRMPYIAPPSPHSRMRGPQALARECSRCRREGRLGPAGRETAGGTRFPAVTQPLAPHGVARGRRGRLRPRAQTGCPLRAAPAQDAARTPPASGTAGGRALLCKQDPAPFTGPFLCFFYFLAVRWGWLASLGKCFVFEIILKGSSGLRDDRADTAPKLRPCTQNRVPDPLARLHSFARGYRAFVFKSLASGGGSLWRL